MTSMDRKTRVRSNFSGEDIASVFTAEEAGNPKDSGFHKQKSRNSELLAAYRAKKRQNETQRDNPLADESEVLSGDDAGTQLGRDDSRRPPQYRQSGPPRNRGFRQGQSQRPPKDKVNGGGPKGNGKKRSGFRRLLRR